MYLKSQLIRLVFLICFMTFSIEAMGEEMNAHRPAPIIIFVSFSMTDASLKQWMRQAEIIHAPVVCSDNYNSLSASQLND